MAKVSASAWITKTCRFHLKMLRLNYMNSKRVDYFVPMIMRLNEGS